VQNSPAKSLIAALESYWHYFFKTYHQIDCFISPSVFLMKKFREFGFNAKIFYLPNPVFSEDMYGAPYAEGEYVLYYGRLAEEKGVQDLLKAYSSIKTEIGLNLVGDGPLAEELKKKARRSGGKNIKFFGRLEGERLWGMVKGAKVVVIPSRWYENAPYSILEPMVLGRPVLVSGIGGLAEIVKDGQNGFTFKVGDIDDLGFKLKRILDDADLLAEVGQRAEKDIKSNNSPEAYYNYLIDIYFQAYCQMKEG